MGYIHIVNRAIILLLNLYINLKHMVNTLLLSCSVILSFKIFKLGKSENPHEIKDPMCQSDHLRK